MITLGNNEISCFNLDNNLTIQLVPIPKGKSALFAISFYAGALYEEGFGQGSNDGISHFLEHMFFKGTPNLSTKQVNEEFSKLGADLNAYTSHDHTVYYAKVPSRHLNRASELWKRLLTNKEFYSSELEAEKQVILQEIQLYSDMPDYKANSKARELHFKNTPLEHSILGTIDSVNAITVEMLQDYSSKYYTLDNAVLTIVGGFKLSQHVKFYTKLFGEDIEHTKKSPLFPPPIKTRKRENSIEYSFEKTTKPLTYVTINWNFPGTKDPLFFSLLLLNSFIGNSRTSTLYRNIISKGLTGSCRYGFEPFFDVSSSNISFVSPPSNTKVIFDNILEILKHIYEMKITPELLERLQDEVWGSYLGEIEDPANYGIDLTQKYFKLRKPFSANKFFAHLSQVTPDEVQTIKDKSLEKLNLTVYATGNIPAKWKPDFPDSYPW